MSNRSTEYKINNSIFIVQYGNITTIQADVIVSSDDNYISMGGGVSAAIRHAAGSSIVEEAKKQLPIKIGEVAVTSSGKLKTKFVFHAITIDYDTWQYANSEIIQSATIKCLQLADSLKLKHIAFPALGTGVAGVPFEITAKTMTETIGKYLLGNTQIERVTITLYARESISESQLNLFYEHSVGIVAFMCQSNKLDFLLSDIKGVFQSLGRNDLLSDIENLKAKINATQNAIQEPVAKNNDNQDTKSDFSTSENDLRLNKLSKEIQKFSNKKIEEFNDKQLESNLLRTKLNGYYTTLNIKTAQLNKFEIEKAKYGGISVPPRLEIAIDDLNNEISNIEKKIRKIRKRQVELNNPFIE